jgi:hypothetical protein
MSELRDLIEGVCTDTLTPPQAERLNTLLRESNEARRTYLDYLGLHACLSWEFGPRTGIKAPEPGRLRAWIGPSAAALLLLGILGFLLRPAPIATPATHPSRLPWNDGRLDAVEIWPAPPGLAIDGDLSDWGSQGRFRSECRPPDGEARWLEGMLRYDARALYIAARVGDPFALRSRIDPKTEAAFGWMGGAVQLRLSTDRSQPWPVQADHLEIRRRLGREKRPDDDARSRVHLTMWYDSQRKEPCLHLAYGMAFEGDVINPPGSRGVITPAPDGKGYLLEYEIPWAVLGAGGNPPRSGDTLAASWTVTWADETGRAVLGQLVDVLNPDHSETRWIFMRAGDWGKARYR